MDWRDEVWFFDTEVLPHDWLFCATNKEKRVAIHNDAAMLREFLETERPFLCGYNCKHYDNYIIKAILAGGTPEDVKAVNDAIIVDGMQGWEIDMGWVKLPQSFDLMLDLPTRPSLKMIEGNLKMDIRESEVDFNTEYPTKEQWEELEEYCWHDVEALIPLYDARLPYLEAKETLAEMKGLNVKSALNMTNAKLTALFLGAQRVERDDEREYEMPSEINVEDIPQELLDFFSRMSDENISDDELFKSEVKVKLMEDCTVTYGWGGCHQGISNYVEETSEKDFD